MHAEPNGQRQYTSPPMLSFNYTGTRGTYLLFTVSNLYLPIFTWVKTTYQNRNTAYSENECLQ